MKVDIDALSYDELIEMLQKKSGKVIDLKKK